MVVALKRVGNFEERSNDANDRVLCLARTRTEAATEAEGRMERVASLEEGKERRATGYITARFCQCLTKKITYRWPLIGGVGYSHA
jgi:hypothetical protein